MKIEKVNDNQIRCTLTKEDLADRHLKISEIAYGTEKAKNLFRDMMQQASYEFGFEADDIPLMIEAIPISSDTIILLITKVEYPEELDTRFSKFSDFDEDYTDSSETYEAATANDILDLFQRLQKENNHSGSSSSSKKKKIDPDDFVPLNKAVRHETKETIPSTPAANVPVDLTKLYLIPDLDTLSQIASILNGFYEGRNSVYLDTQTHHFYLVLHKSNHTPEDFNKVCNILSEYVTQLKFTKSVESYFNEHFDCLISDCALQQFTRI